MRKILFLCLTLLFFICNTGCTKEQISENTNNNYSDTPENPANPNPEPDPEPNNQLVGTSWKGQLWYAMYNRESACIEFTSNTQLFVTLLFRGDAETTTQGTYTLEGNNIVFHNLSAHGYCYTFEFRTATFTNTIMTVQGAQSGDEKTWTFNKL